MKGKSMQNDNEDIFYIIFLLLYGEQLRAEKIRRKKWYAFETLSS